MQTLFSWQLFVTQVVYTFHIVAAVMSQQRYDLANIFRCDSVSVSAVSAAAAAAAASAGEVSATQLWGNASGDSAPPVPAPAFGAGAASQDQQVVQQNDMLVDSQYSQGDALSPGPQTTLASNKRFGFSFSVPARLPSQRALVDPTVEMTTRLKSVTSLEELQQIVHPADLFSGYSNKEEIYATVKRQLAEIADRTLTYLELATEDNSMSCFALEPFRKALLTLSVREMWPQEVLHQGILANTGWLEEVNTRLRHREEDEHERTPNVLSLIHI